MRRSTIVLIFVFLTLTLMFGCSKGKMESNSAGMMKIFRDQLDRRVKVKFPPRRIVSMAPSVTEMLFAIGLGDKIVGVTDYCDYPPAALKKPKIGGYYNPNVETILSLNPDLVIATADGYNRGVVNKLTSLGVSCYVVNPQTIEGILNTMIELGRITGRAKEAQETVERLRRRVEAIRSKVREIPPDRRVKVFYCVGPTELWTAGSGTYIDDLIEEAGGINIAHGSKQRWFQFSGEELIKDNPDVIIVAGMISNDKAVDLPLWSKYKEVKAVREGKIYPFDPDMLNRPGPRSVDVLEMMFKRFYPSGGSADDK
ncbi:cobalamin-binding protein [Candidatus Poribacteria bacterium]|nr:cobalamin-binding protein [Candidatus Poribacteria bacterium]